MSNDYTSSGFIVTGNHTIKSGDTYCDTTVKADGYLTVLSGGSAIGSEKGANIVSGTTNNSARIKLNSGAYISKMTIASWGEARISGTADALTVAKDGLARVTSGGIVNNAKVSGGLGKNTASAFGYTEQLIIEKGGITNNTTLTNRGTEAVQNGGKAVGTLVSNGGSQIVSAGGTTSKTVVQGGVQTVLKDGNALETHIQKGSQEILSGAVVMETLVTGGSQSVKDGGIALLTQVTSAGTLAVNGGTALYCSVDSGGKIDIYSGCAESTVVLESGTMTVYSGGTAADTKINVGGTMTVSEGGVIDGEETAAAIGTTVTLEEGAVINGKIFSQGTISINGNLVFGDDNDGLYIWLTSNEDQPHPIEDTIIKNFSLIADQSRHCFIAADSSVASNTYAIAAGAGEFSGEIAIYHDDWQDSVSYISVGETLTSNYIEYTLLNENDTLFVSINNQTLYEETAAEWEISGSTAKTTFDTLYAGRYFLRDFTGSNFTGTVSVKKSDNGKITNIVTLNVKNGSINDPQKNDFLLDGNSQYIIECNIKSGAVKENSAQAHVAASTIFYRANMYEDNAFNALCNNDPSKNQPRVNVTPDDNDKIREDISDKYSFEYVGYGDLQDWRQLNISADGTYTISIRKDLTQSTKSNNDIKATLYQVNGTALKSIASVTVANGKEAGELISEKQLAAGTYYLLYEAPKGKNGYASVYASEITGSALFKAPSDSESALTTSLSIGIDNESAESILSFASPSIYYAWNVEQACLYVFSAAALLENSKGNNAFTITVYKADDNKTALTKVLSFSTKNVETFTETFSKETFFDQGEYFICVSSAQAPKGAEVNFKITADATNTYPVPVSSNTNFLNARQVTVSKKSVKLADKLYAGFDSPSDWMCLDLTGNAASGGTFTINADNSGNGNATVTLWVLNGDTLKKVKTISVSAGKSVSLAGIKLEQGKTYYLQTDAASAAKTNKYAELTVSLEGTLNPSVSIPSPGQNEAGNFVNALSYYLSDGANKTVTKNCYVGKGATVRWIALNLSGDALKGGTFSFDIQNTGTGSANITIWYLDNGKLKKAKSVTVKNGKTASLANIQLDPGKQWFLQIDGSAAGKADQYASIDISRSGKIDGFDIVTPSTPSDSFDNSVWKLDSECEYSLDDIREDPVIAEDETLNKDDVSDFRMISLDHSGFFNYTLSSDDHNANVTATLYKWNADGSALVKVNAVTVNTKNNTAQLKSDVFLTQGDYYIEVTCANTAKGGYAVYDLMFNAPVVFDSPYISTDDDSIFTAVVFDSPSTDDDSIFTAEDISVENFVCIDDAIDYFKWVLDDAAYGNLVLSSKDHNANVTATLYKWNDNGSALTKVTSLVLSAKADTAQLKKDLLLDKGEYFISVTCANTAKGGYAGYTLSLQTPVVFKQSVLNNQDDNMAGAQLVSSTGTVVKEEFVGYGDTVDFLKLNDVESGNHTFKVHVTDKAKFTLYRYDLKSNKLVAVVSTKTLTAGNNTLAAVHLESGVDYYLQVQTVDVKGEVIYGIESKVNAAKQYDDQNEPLDLDAAAKGEETIVNFNVSSQDAGWLYAFNDSSLGDMQLFMYDEAKGNLKQIKFKDGVSIALAQGSYYLKLQASASIGKSCLVFDAETRSFSWDPQLA